jgi:hypothetical protein
MYRRPKFLEVLLRIREEMAREADYDVDLFAEMVRSGSMPAPRESYTLADTDEKPEGRGGGKKAKPKDTKQSERSS